jgi:hypothetical protein
MKTYKFIRTGREWYIDLPEYVELGGDFGDLQMVDGADRMLDNIAGQADNVSLIISDNKFPGADILILKEKCEPVIGGGYYFLENFEGNKFNQTMWLCQVTEFVFGGIPDQIFIKRDNSQASL